MPRSPVGAYLSPGGRGAGILFGHWGLGNRSEFIPEAIHYAEQGAVSLLINWPWTRRPPDQRDEGPLDRPEMDRNVHAQAIVDLRRGLDLLTARADVDRARLGYIGHSYGAQFGAVMTANDPRVAATVLMAGIPDRRTFLVEADDPWNIDYRKKWTAAQIDRYLEVNRVTAAITWVGRGLAAAAAHAVRGVRGRHSHGVDAALRPGGARSRRRSSGIPPGTSSTTRRHGRTAPSGCRGSSVSTPGPELFLASRG